jgi:hypothetical protein
MGAEIRTSPEPNPQFSELRCPGCMVSWGTKFKKPKYYLCQLILINCRSCPDVDCYPRYQCRDRRICIRKLMKRMALCLCRNSLLSARKKDIPTNRNGDPKAAAGWMHGQCRAAAVPGLSVDLRDDERYGNHRDGSSNNIEFHLTEPRQCLQAGITQEENHHQTNNQFVHVYLRYHLLFRWFYLRRLTTRYP